MARKNPDDQYALLRFGIMTFLDGKYTEAEAAYKKVKNLEPVYIIDLVKVLLAQNKSDEAEEYLAKAMATGQLRRSPYAGIGNFCTSWKSIRKQYSFMRKL
jgi:hypothetical protein